MSDSSSSQKRVSAAAIASGQQEQRGLAGHSALSAHPQLCLTSTLNYFCPFHQLPCREIAAGESTQHALPTRPADAGGHQWLVPGAQPVCAALPHAALAGHLPSAQSSARAVHLGHAQQVVRPCRFVQHLCQRSVSGSG